MDGVETPRVQNQGVVEEDVPPFLPAPLCRRGTYIKGAALPRARFLSRARGILPRARRGGARTKVMETPCVRNQGGVEEDVFLWGGADP